jgi:1-acyl-sn-glycerol-3-phosphate acyltransferase
LSAKPPPLSSRLKASLDITVAAAAILARIGYGTYAWLALLAIAVPTAGVLAVTPGIGRRRRLVRWSARLFLTAIGAHPRIDGSPPSDPSRCIVVANHASYLDGIVLTALLPPRFSFLIKHEMARVPLASFILRRIGAQFVNRGNAFHRHRSGRALVAAAADGGALAVFPEGTFDERPGLRPFQMGAFRAAWRARSSIVPVVIRGARQKLPAGAWLPRPGPVSVQFLGALAAADYRGATALMHASRIALLAQLGEPDLDAAAPPAAETRPDGPLPDAASSGRSAGGGHMSV